MRRIETVVKSFDLDLYDVEVNERQRVVRIYIDSPTGVTIGQCTEIAGLLNPVISHESYKLEVSSPGVERRLRSKEDFRDAVGMTIKVKTEKGIKVGRLVRVVDDGFDLETDVETRSYTFKSVRRVNLVVSNDELFGRKSARHH